jgi:putative ABC transport system permease protein
MNFFSKLNTFNAAIALEAVKSNWLRSILTALGIIFGVAAVIAMLAIGSGAKQEILAQIELIGVNNIVVKAVFDDDEQAGESDDGDEVKKKFSPGLTLLDAENIRNAIPTVALVSPEIRLDETALRRGRRGSIQLAGVDNNFFELNNFTFAQGGDFAPANLVGGAPVCVIGAGVVKRFFPNDNPLGGKIKCGKEWLEVVGVLASRNITSEAQENLDISDYNEDVFIPVKTMLLRYRNRALVTSGMLRDQTTFVGGGSVMITSNGSADKEKQKYHQLDRLVVQVKNTEDMIATSEVIKRMLERRHLGVEDYKLSIPELLLKQQQDTKELFNLVLGAIASISLIVGGIGIMNIMLASVLERIREIGLRLALGATKKDVVQQFLLEAVIISVSGGLIGIILGVGLSFLVSVIADIATVISASSIVLAFSVSAGVGLLFGYMPAKRAAEQDPIKSLRYE